MAIDAQVTPSTVLAKGQEFAVTPRSRLVKPLACRDRRVGPFHWFA